jgi:hypothetical protein
MVTTLKCGKYVVMLPAGGVMLGHSKESENQVFG